MSCVSIEQKSIPLNENFTLQANLRQTIAASLCVNASGREQTLGGRRRRRYRQNVQRERRQSRKHRSVFAPENGGFVIELHDFRQLRGTNVSVKRSSVSSADLKEKIGFGMDVTGRLIFFVKEPNSDVAFRSAGRALVVQSAH